MIKRSINKNVFKEHKGKAFNKIYKNSGFKASCEHNIVKLVSEGSGKLTEKQINMVKFSSRKFVKRSGFFIGGIYGNKFVTKKPLEVRMGKGKGAFHHKIDRISSGKNLLYLNMKSNTVIPIGIKILEVLQKKLPIKTKISVI